MARIAAYVGIIVISLVIGGAIGYTVASNQPPLSPYVEQMASPIRGLSIQEVDDLLEGRGAGYARTAELNSYPGPRHLLDLAEPLTLSPVQIAQFTRIFNSMEREAQSIGADIVEAEQHLSASFADTTISDETLSHQISDLADLYGQLRGVHLQAHIQSRSLLTEEQIAHYNTLRGYNQAATDAPSHPMNH
jgi:hypothetical protein